MLASRKSTEMQLDEWLHQKYLKKLRCHSLKVFEEAARVDQGLVNEYFKRVLRLDNCNQNPHLQLGHKCKTILTPTIYEPAM